MLEDLAINFLSQSEDIHFQIRLGLLGVGAIVAGIITRSKAELARTPHFAYGALIIFTVNAVEIVWFQVFAAAAAGYLWVLTVISLTAPIIGGYSLCRIAMARSRDAYGHGGMAFLTFIPIANFWLLLTRSKNEISSNRGPTIPLLSGWRGVLVGFVLLVAASGVNVFIKEQVRMMEHEVQTESGSPQAMIDSMIRSNGLEEALRRIAAQAKTPITVDEVTTLARIEAAWTQLRRTYIVDLEGMTMTEELRSRSLDGICAWPAFEPILRAGGSIREVYVERGGREVGVVMVTRAECGF